LTVKATELTVEQVQQGDAAARDQLIREFRPFIIRTVRYICKRPIDWNDDEASIGLIAFDEAIDRYNASCGKSFDNFAYMLIRNRLIDEFRKNGKHSGNISLDMAANGGQEQAWSEIASSLEAYERETAAQELVQELIRYDETLQEYGVQLEELEECSPSHRDARVQLIRMAKSFCARPDWLSYLKRTRNLPIKDMLNFVEVSRKTIERNRKYLIALILIFDTEDFVRIRSTVSFAQVGE